MGVSELTQNGDAVRVYPVDVEHAGIRVTLPILIVISGILIYALLSPLVASVLNGLIGSDAFNGLATFALAVAGGLAVGALADRFLKARWPSGRSLRLEPDSLVLRDDRRGKRNEVRINFATRINVLAWRFVVKRSTPRAPSGWEMLACQIGQDDEGLIVYTFMPPKVAAALPQRSAFTLLAARKEIENGKLSLRESTEQRRLLKVENQRWEDGAELRPADFTSLVASLAPHIPDWRGV